MLLSPRHAWPIAIIALLALSLPRHDAIAQQTRSRGDDFWITFMPNHGSEGDQEVLEPRLHIVAERPAVVTITSSEMGESHVVRLDRAPFTAEVDLRETFNDRVELADVTSGAAITRRSFNVTATTDIVLIAMSLKYKSADAFMTLPADLLGAHYYVLGYRNGRGYESAPGGFDMPSEFAVVATADNTTIQIAPRAGNPIRGYGDAPFSVKLDRGQVFLGQAETGGAADLSGTEVVASAPVALFGGCKRTSIPTPIGNYRDFVAEQLPPTGTWGREFMVFRTFEPSWLSRDTSRLRVLAGSLGATINIEGNLGTSEYILQPGTFFEIPVTEAMAMRSTQPVLAAFYQHSVNAETKVTDTATALRGDPFMMLIPPVEWFDTSYQIVVPSSNAFKDVHYADVTIPEDAVRTLRVDGELVHYNSYPIWWTTYRYAHIRLTTGAHTITASRPFGLTVYGFGDMVSYGYLGGMRVTNMTQSVDARDAAHAAMSIALTGDRACGASCTLELMLRRPEQVRVELVDLRGSVVRTLLEERHLEAGAHPIAIELASLPGGIYLCRAVASSGASSEAKVVVAR